MSSGYRYHFSSGMLLTLLSLMIRSEYTVPPWLKWILVLPAAIGGFVVVQIFIVLGGLFLDTGSYYAQFASALLCPAAFVSAGSTVAPAYRYITSICLTIVVAILQTALLTWLIIEKRETTSGLAWLIFCGLAGVVACVAECHAFYDGELREARIRNARGPHETTCT
jgi:hypothetical protein